MVLCRQIPDWRVKKGRDYPLHCRLAIRVMATLSGIVRGQRDLAAFAAKLTRFQLRALGSYRKRSGGRDYPKETTFQRILAKLDAEAFQRILTEWEIQRAGQETADDQIAIDGKAQRGSTPHVADETRGGELLERIRRYWDIEGGLHQRLDVSGGEDASRVRNRNALLVLGLLRRSAVGIY